MRSLNIASMRIVDRVRDALGIVPRLDYDVALQRLRTAENALAFLAWANDAEILQEWEYVQKSQPKRRPPVADAMRELARRGSSTPTIPMVQRKLSWHMNQPSPLAQLFGRA